MFTYKKTVEEKGDLTELDPRKEKEKEEDLKLMKDHTSWAIWSMLPVKKMPDNGEMPECGFLLATGKPIVYLRNMYDLQDMGITTIKEIMEKIDGKDYPSFEDIVNDGWIVD
jgi:nucleoside 2-deoxyribosyltransferase